MGGSQTMWGGGEHFLRTAGTARVLGATGWWRGTSCAVSPSVRWVRKTENIVARLLRSSTSCVADQRLVEQNHLQMVGFEVKAEEKGRQSPDLPLVSSL